MDPTLSSEQDVAGALGYQTRLKHAVNKLNGKQVNLDPAGKIDLGGVAGSVWMDTAGTTVRKSEKPSTPPIAEQLLQAQLRRAYSEMDVLRAEHATVREALRRALKREDALSAMYGVVAQEHALFRARLASSELL